MQAQRLSGAAETEHFGARGWFVAPAALSRADLGPLVAAADALLEAALGPHQGGPGVVQIPTPRHQIPAVLAALRRPELAGRAARLLGCARVQLLQDALVIKRPGGGAGIDWHQDHTYTGFLTPPRVLSIRLALTEETPLTGALEVLDTSHLAGVGRVDGVSAGALLADEAATGRALAATLPVRVLPLRPGDASFHSCLTFHRSGDTCGPAPRVTLVAHVFDAACRVDPARLPPGAAEHFPRDPSGHLDPAHFPLLWPAGQGPSVS